MAYIGSGKMLVVPSFLSQVIIKHISGSLTPSVSHVHFPLSLCCILGIYSVISPAVCRNWLVRLFSIPSSLSSHWEFEIDRGGSRHTMEIGKCFNNRAFPSSGELVIRHLSAHHHIQSIFTQSLFLCLTYP